MDSSRYQGSLQWAPVVKQGLFNIEVVDVKVGDLSLELPSFLYGTTAGTLGAFVDSGTSIILVNPLTFSAIQTIFQTKYHHLPGVNSTFFSNGPSVCIPTYQMGSKLSLFPNLYFHVRGMDGKTIELHVPPQNYILLFDNQYCFGIAAVPGIGIVLGDAFMQGYYVAFDRQNAMIGFATIKDCN